MTPFSQFISFLFDSCYHWCLKLIQKVEYGWAAWGEWKQDCTRWDQTDDSSNSPASPARVNGIFLSLVLTILFCVLTTSVIFFNCFEQHTLCLPDMISRVHVNKCGPNKAHSTSVSTRLRCLNPTTSTIVMEHFVLGSCWELSNNFLNREHTASLLFFTSLMFFAFW